MTRFGESATVEAIQQVAGWKPSLPNLMHTLASRCEDLRSRPFYLSAISGTPQNPGLGLGLCGTFEEKPALPRSGSGEFR